MRCPRAGGCCSASALHLGEADRRRPRAYFRRRRKPGRAYPGVAAPGGIAVSRAVKDVTELQIDGIFVDAGEQRLKNVSRPVQIYHVRPAENVLARTTTSVVPRTILRFPGTDTGGLRVRPERHPRQADRLAFRIGDRSRSDKCELPLVHSTVSRRHARLLFFRRPSADRGSGIDQRHPRERCGGASWRTACGSNRRQSQDRRDRVRGNGVKLVAMASINKRPSPTPTITARWQVTLAKDILQHLGVQPSEKLELHKLPGGRIALPPRAGSTKVHRAAGGPDVEGATLEEIEPPQPEEQHGREAPNNSGRVPPSTGERAGEAGFEWLSKGHIARPGAEDIRIVRAPAEGDDPFACFSEWASEADRKLWRSLTGSTSSRCPSLHRSAGPAAAAGARRFPTSARAGHRTIVGIRHYRRLTTHAAPFPSHLSRLISSHTASKPR